MLAFWSMLFRVSSVGTTKDKSSKGTTDLALCRDSRDRRAKSAQFLEVKGNPTKNPKHACLKFETTVS